MPSKPKQIERTKTGKVLIRRRGKGSNEAGAGDGNWWAKENARQRAQGLWETVTLLDRHHQPRHYLDALYIGLYEGAPPYWIGNYAQGSPYKSSGDIGGGSRGLNIFKSAIDTAASLISKNLAELRVLTSGGSWREQKRARGLTKYLAGAFDAMDYHAHQQRAFIDGCLSRARGAVKFWIDWQKAKVVCGRVHPRTLLWNELEGDSPSSLYQYTPYPRETLLRWFPEQRAIIEAADPSVNPVNPAYRRASGLAKHADMIDVAEGWHLNGVHTMALEKGELHTEDWDHEFFPFADFSWDDANEGWGGRPAGDTLAPYQVRLNKMLKIALVATGRAAGMAGAYVEEGSEVVEDKMLGGDMWSVRKFRGTPPVFSAPNPLPPQFWDFFWRLKEEAFAEMGLSLLQAQGQKPAGLESGEALLQFNDITATRQVVKGQRLERMTEKAGTITVALSKKLYAKRPDLRVLAPGTKVLEEIAWKDVNPEEDAYTLRSFAVSALPTHVVGRIDAVVKIIKAGLLPQEEVQNGLGLKLLDFPDLEKATTLHTAKIELAQMQADEALYEGRFIGPEPFQGIDGLEALLLTAQRTYLVALQMKDVPERNMEYLRRLMSEANETLARLKGGSGPALPAATPAATPQPAPGAPAVATAETIGAAPIASPAVPSATPATGLV